MSIHFFEILQYTIPSLVVLFGVYFVINRFLMEESNKLNIMNRHFVMKENQKISLPLRFQAYERLALFLERVHPQQLVARNFITNISSEEYKNKLIIDINTEFQFNLTQQIYVSDDIWQLLRQVKEQTKILLNEIGEKLPENATAQDFANAIFHFVETTPADKIPVNVGLKYLKNEVAQIY
ncbi:MAG: hypothetical protein LC105_05200 [Chitinophagales bacterium]|nr:hypothetical protein [Chitinophagales bacterium]MCZ2393233.1 hypothetical protein [Chitinophagales bacterium]